jgi:dihydroorotate dehydrogenase
VIYRYLFSLLLKRIPPEAAHRMASRFLRALVRVPGATRALAHLYGCHDDALEVAAFGLRFPSPIGVAAGVDKDATWFEELGLLGFGCVEIGTVTAKAQEGNPLPRIFRLTGDRALLNKMGFPNPGAEVVAERLTRRAGGVVVGVNVGKSMTVSIDDAGPDYRQCVRKLAPLADYLVVNVSSPNTPGLTEMQAVSLLRPLLREVREELDACQAKVPLLIKIGPDVSNAGIAALADLAVELELDGIVAVNTTASRTGLTDDSSIEQVPGGGISGVPLQARALEVLRLLYAQVGERLPLISVGGILTPQDAWERILAGATLLQCYTGLVYGGPAWASQVNAYLSQQAHRAGAESIQQMVGAEHRAKQAGAGGATAAATKAHRPTVRHASSVGATP